MGKHQCQPVGFKGHEVDYNQIDDRKCDCCDGSDERPGDGAHCPNVCRRRYSKEANMPASLW